MDDWGGGRHLVHQWASGLAIFPGARIEAHAQATAWLHGRVRGKLLRRVVTRAHAFCHVGDATVRGRPSGY